MRRGHQGSCGLCESHRRVPLKSVRRCKWEGARGKVQVGRCGGWWVGALGMGHGAWGMGHSVNLSAKAQVHLKVKSKKLALIRKSREMEIKEGDKSIN